jgi:HD-GYP domain-containing protein (c-di-GMP phosphodiesterase class II)
MSVVSSDLANFAAPAVERAQDIWFDITGTRGWRMVAGPAAFAGGALVLLVYDHLQQKVPPFLFWLTLALIASVFIWMLENSRRQQLDLIQESDRNALSDKVTGLDNRICLEKDIRESSERPGDRRVLLLFDLDGLQTYNDRFGYTAGDELVRRIAEAMVRSATPMGGRAYRIDDSRLALLVPAADRRLGEIVLAATASLHDEGRDLLIGRAYGEVAIPDEATDPEIAMQIAGQRLAAHNQRQHRSARRQAHAVLMAVLGARRPELRNHLRVVAYRSISLGRRLGLGREEIDDVALAAELQDVGLLAVPEAVLEKEGRLSDEEIRLIRNRPIAGERIIGAAPGLAPVAALVRASAERFDGSGFPDGLAGEAIPLGSRIIAVAVAFAALTSARPYRPAGSPEDALVELRRCAGSQFDPEVVEALAADLDEEQASVAPAPAVVA